MKGITVNKPQFDTDNIKPGTLVSITTRLKGGVAYLMPSLYKQLSFVKWVTPLKLGIIYLDGKETKELTIEIDDIVSKEYIMKRIEWHEVEDEE